MATHLERSRRRRLAPGISMAAGIIIFMIGIYTVFGISAQTDKKLARCTEETTGVVTDVSASGSGYFITIEYTPGYSPVSVTLDSKEKYDPGDEIPVKYDPMSFRNINIEGITKTGSSDRVTGIIEILAGAALVAAGLFLSKPGRARRRN